MAAALLATLCGTGTASLVDVGHLTVFGQCVQCDPVADEGADPVTDVEEAT